MKDTKEYLKVEKGALDGWTRESHPSYGAIRISNVTNGAQGVALFDSDVRHQHLINIVISEADKNSDGTYSNVYANREVASVYLSAAQFAEFITTPNQGSGTPCTIERIWGDETRYELDSHGNRPAPPGPEPFLDKYKREAQERATLMLQHINYASSLVQQILEGAEKPTKLNLKEVYNRLDRARTEIRSNLPYVLEVLDEHMEKRMSTAVTEFESYVSESLRRKGLEFLQSGAPEWKPIASSVEVKLLEDGEG